jgi:hypothetical protein
MKSISRWLTVPVGVCVSAALMSCGNSTAPSASIVVNVSTTSSNVLPGQTVGTTVQVTAGSGVRIDSLTIATSGVLTSTQTFPAGVTGVFTATENFTVPSSIGAGMLTIKATAHAGASIGTGETRVAVADTSHPTLQLSVTPQGTIVEPGDTVTIAVTATDAAALQYTAVKITGSFVYTDSASAAYAPYVQRTVKVQVPTTAALKSTLQITGLAENVGGVTTTLALPVITVADTAHPVVSGTLTTTHGAGGAAPGDTITMTVTASDRRKLAYVGFAFGPPANMVDSVATSLPSYTLTVPITVPSSWTGTSSYSVFARDSVGNRTSVVLGDLQVASRTRRPVATVSLPGAVRDAAFDPKRNLVYLSVPSLQQVAVLSMATNTYGTSYSFGGSPHGVDLTPGGDSLVVALVQTPDVAVVNLVNGTTTLLPVTSGTGPDFLRVSSTNKALVTITFAGSGYGGSFVEADLATGATRNLRTVTEYVPLAGSGNRGRILALIDDSCCPEEAFVYDAASGSIVADAGTVSSYFNPVSADVTGATYLISSGVFSGSLAPITAYSGNLYAGGPTVISSDGKSGYFATSTGVVQIRFSDGAPLATFTLGELPAGLWMSRDGLTIFAAGATHGYVIDLW